MMMEKEENNIEKEKNIDMEAFCRRMKKMMNLVHSSFFFLSFDPDFCHIYMTVCWKVSARLSNSCPVFPPPPTPRVSFSKFSFAVLVFVCFFWQKKWSYTGGENEKNVKKMFFLTKIYPSQIDQKREKKSFLTKKVTFFVKNRQKWLFWSICDG